MDATETTPELQPLDQGVHVLRVLCSPKEAARRVIVLHDAPVGIGRAPGAADFEGLLLDDSQVSRNHAHIELRSESPRSFRFVDQGSQNGSFVNGHKCTERELEDGDVIRVGSSLLLFHHVPLASLELRGQSAGPSAALLGDSSCMRAARKTLKELAPLPEPVLVLGETGSGKELAARALHDEARRTGPLIAFNCGALASELVLNELFGHGPHGFSGGAKGGRDGYLHAAGDGTLFLDEVGDLEPPVQTALLRVLQEKVYRRIGETEERKLTARIVAATNRDLPQDIAQGRFREDLYHRLRAHTVWLPPLRARREDIRTLVEHFLGPAITPTIDAWEALHAYAWPGNVRELEQVLAAAKPSCRNGVLELDALRPELLAPFAARRSASVRPPKAALLLDIEPGRKPTEEQLRRAMEHFHGVVEQVATFFEKDRKQVHRWLEEYGIDRELYRSR